MKKIIVGIASVPDRIKCLRDTIDSLYDQCDTIIVGLNNYTEIPDFLNKTKIKTYLLDNSLGDAAKFYKIQDYKNSYYFSVDDDLLYPPDYTSVLIEKVKQHKGIVGLHGIIMLHPIKTYYSSRKVFHWKKGLENDTIVDVLGTGCCCFDTEQLQINISDFKVPNMADVWLADLAKKQNIKCVSIARKINWIRYNQKMVSDKIKTIFSDYSRTKNDKIQTEIVKKWSKL